MMQMKEHKKNEDGSGCCSLPFRLILSCFNAFENVDVKDAETASPTGPDFIMVKAAKHFSAAHKVKLA